MVSLTSIVIYFYLSCVWIPAQDPAVLPAAQEQLGISQAPGDGQDTPVHKEQYSSVISSLIL